MSDPIRLDWVNSLFSDDHAAPAVTPVTPRTNGCVTTETKLKSSNHAASSNPLHVLHELHPKIGIPANDPPPTDLDTLAASIAAEFRVRPAAVLGLLDDDDREAIRTGSDPGRADAWRAAVASLIHRGEWKPAPEQVTCSDCRHAEPAAPGLIDCAAQVRAPGSCGPFRWWATDRHICESWEAWP